MNTHARSFEDQPQRDWPDDDCSELSRGEMLRNRVSWDYRDTVTPQPVDSFKLVPISLDEIRRAGQAMSGIQTQLVPQELYHGFSKPPEPAKPYPGSYAYPVLYALCALLAITGVGGLWWMVPGWIIPVTALMAIFCVFVWTIVRMGKGN